MDQNIIPDKVIGFNVYDNSEKLVGISGEVTMPTFEAMSESISGAGLLGEIDSPTVGHFSSMTIEIPFRAVFEKSFSLMQYNDGFIYLRAAQQGLSSTGGIISQRGLKITLRGLPKSLELGKLAIGSGTETKNTLELTYIKVEENGKVLVELDKLNSVYILNGVDMLKNINSLI